MPFHVLKLNPNKCEFLKRKVKYVGHVVSEKGIEIDQGKTDKVVNWPTPTTPEDVRRFWDSLGTTNALSIISARSVDRLQT